MTGSVEQPRDRAYARSITIQEIDNRRFLSFVDTLPADRLISKSKFTKGTEVHYHYLLKLKSQELLYIELAFKSTVKKNKKRKKKPDPILSIFGR